MLSSTVRNGLLVYRPCKGALVKICDQEWAQQMSLGVGTKRIPESWLSNCYNWLSKDGVPLPPDFKLSSNIKAVSDLIEWSYDSPAPAEDGADDSVDVPDKAAERQNRALVRRVLRSKLLCALSKKLKDRSKQEVLFGIVPRATTSKAKKVAASTVKDSEKASATASAKKAPKLSVVSKPSLKTKPSLKLKASAAKKEAKKHSKKKAADALAGKMVSAAKKAEEEVDTRSWPLPLNTTVRVVSEEAGPLCFGREGDVKGFSDGKLHVFSAFSVPASLVQAKNSGWASPRCWKGFNSMSRETLRGILRVTGALQMPLEEKSFDHVLVKVPSSFDVLGRTAHSRGLGAALLDLASRDEGVRSCRTRSALPAGGCECRL